MTPQQVLKQYWNYDDFRPGQLGIVEQILSGRDVLAILPTGGGKSICFQVPALILPGLTVVVSPLISLMKDQVDALVKRNVPAAFLSSTQSAKEQCSVFQMLTENKLKLLYLSPERLQSKQFVDAVKNLGISLVVVDEAHCISEWGHDFRPEFRLISRFVAERTLRPAVAAFTATATPATQADITYSLRLRQPFVHLSSFARTNLALHVTHCRSTFLQYLALWHILKKHHADSGIIYVSSRATADVLAKTISATFPSVSIAAYHAGLTATERDRIQNDFIADRIRIVTATNAFGMGIDKPNIRFVAHYHTPGSLEHFYQEVGRGGRDGAQSQTYLLFNQQNLAIHLGLLHKSNLTSSFRRHQLSKLHAMRQYALATDCRQNYILRYFGEQSTKPCERCDVCQHQQNQVFSLDQAETKLLNELSQIRQHLAGSLQKPPVAIASDRILYQLTLLKPHSLADAKQIVGVGEGWIKHWWQSFEPPLRK